MEIWPQLLEYATKANVGWVSVVAATVVLVLAFQAPSILKEIFTFWNDRKRILAKIDQSVKRDAELIRQKQQKRAKKIKKSKQTPKIRKT